MTAGEIKKRLVTVTTDTMKVMAAAQTLYKRIKNNHYLEPELRDIVPRGNSLCREIRTQCCYLGNLGDGTEVGDPYVLRWPDLAREKLDILRATVERVRALLP